MTGTVGDHLLAKQLFWPLALCMLRAAKAPDAVYGPCSDPVAEGPGRGCRGERDPEQWPQ